MNVRDEGKYKGRDFIRKNSLESNLTKVATFLKIKLKSFPVSCLGQMVINHLSRNLNVNS